MTTNQTIDGVPRELIARAVTAAHIADCPSLRDELRALLDSPACKRCNGSGWIDNLRPVGTQAMDCPDCKPATQVRGEPVTMDGKTTIREYVSNSVPEDQIGDDWTKGYEECKRRIHQMFQQPVNAERPAPVAVTDTRTSFEIEHDASTGDEAAFRKWRAERSKK